MGCTYIVTNLRENLKNIAFNVKILIIARLQNTLQFIHSLPYLFMHSIQKGYNP